MVDHQALQLQKLDMQGVEALVSWAQQEGWNPGINDAKIFWATDPDGFYGYFHGDELVAGGSVVSYSGQFGFMGLFIVKPEYRASGIGRKLWYQRRDLLLSRLNDGAAIGMDGVVAMQPFYHKGGFDIAYRDERYAATGRPFDIDSNISPITDADIDAILEYDKACFGAERPSFMKPWLSQPGASAFKYLQDGALKGFAVMRKAVEGYKICPLFADDAGIAEALYRACLNAAPEAPVFIDIPVVNTEATELVKRYNSSYVFECARMYLGQPPAQQLHKVFGITTFELG